MREAGSANESVAHVVDLLSGWAPVAARRMFGGYGLYRGAVMFALLTGDVLYFKTDALNRPDYAAAGMAPFSYARAGRAAVIMSYHAVPPGLLESDGGLAAWAERAFAAALRARQAKPAPRPRSASRPRKRG